MNKHDNNDNDNHGAAKLRVLVRKCHYSRPIADEYHMIINVTM